MNRTIQFDVCDELGEQAGYQGRRGGVTPANAMKTSALKKS